MRYAAILSIAMHVSPVLAAINYHDLRRDTADLATAQYRGIRRNLRELLHGRPNLDFSLEGLFDGDGKDMSETEKKEWERKVEDIIIYRPDIAKQMIEEGKLDLDAFLRWRKNFHGRFFIETEGLRGTSEEDTVEARQKMKALYDAIKMEMENKRKARCGNETFNYGCLPDHGMQYVQEEIELLDRIVQKYGQDQTWAANYAGDLVRKEYGNCSSRAKLNLAVVSDLRWAHIKEIRLQGMEIHIRVIIRMSDDNWYAMDGKLRKLPEADLTGTVLIDRNMYVKTYLGLTSAVKYLDENKDGNFRESLHAKIISALTAGADHFLDGEISNNLRSAHDLQWTEKEKPKENMIEVTLEAEPQASGVTIGPEKEGGPEQKEIKKKPEKPEYIIPKKELFNARIDGRMNLHRKNVKNLEQLRGMEVAELILSGTDVSDLSPLGNAPLHTIWINGTKVSDIGSLSGKPIEDINLSGTGTIDLSPLKDAPLKVVNVHQTPVEDISVLTDKPIVRAYLGYSKIKDLSPLKGKAIDQLELGGWHIDEKTIETVNTMPVKKLEIANTDIRDFSALRGTEVEALDITGIQAQDYSGLEKWPKLKIIKISKEQAANAQLKEISRRKAILLFYVEPAPFPTPHTEDNPALGAENNLTRVMTYFGEYMPSID